MDEIKINLKALTSLQRDAIRDQLVKYLIEIPDETNAKAVEILKNFKE